MTRLRRVSVHAPPDRVEELLARFLEVVPGGFEEVSRPDGVELVAYLDDAGEAAVRGAFTDVAAEDVAEGWEDAWRSFHRPVRAGGVWIGPPWEQPPRGEPVVVIDPGRAFGTGAHATTRLCLDLLAVAPRGSLLDVGCGSGVLAIAAARLGFAPVLAIDDDPVAVEVTRANAAANRVVLDARLVDATVTPSPAADVAVANILLGAVEAVLPLLQSRIAITSGYLAGERPIAPGWEWEQGSTAEGWAADLFRADARP